MVLSGVVQSDEQRRVQMFIGERLSDEQRRVQMFIGERPSVANKDCINVLFQMGETWELKNSSTHWGLAYG
jgi:hypothetical protein